MRQKRIIFDLSVLKEFRFLILLIFLLLLIALDPFLDEYEGVQLFLDLLTSAVLLSGIFVVSTRKLTAWVGIALVLPVITITWISHFVEIPRLLIIGNKVIGILFFVFISVVILKHVFRARNVTSEVICGAISVYLFFGVIYGYLFSLLEYVNPGSFSNPGQTVEGLGNFFLYYSFVTLTTLGYGDVAPLVGKARSLAITEAVIGQIYLTVLVARLVGMHISQSND